MLPALERLAGEPLMPNLAVSLHAATDELRNELVPINRKHGLDALLAACRRFPVARRRRITFEYVLLAGVNDAPADARRLARLLSGLRSKVNVIPLNEAPGGAVQATVRRPDRPLRPHPSRRTARRSRSARAAARDIRAACGQLIVDGPQPVDRPAARHGARFLGLGTVLRCRLRVVAVRVVDEPVADAADGEQVPGPRRLRLDVAPAGGR